MQILIDFWAMINTLVIMFALGLHQSTSQAQKPSGFVLGRILIYNTLLPSVVLVIVSKMHLFSSGGLSAMALCIASAGGTSAGAFVKQVKGSQTLMAQSIIFLLLRFSIFSFNINITFCI